MTGLFTVCLLGRIQKVLAEPALVTVVGCSARFVSGAERGDRVEIDLTVKETGERNSSRQLRSRSP